VVNPWSKARSNPAYTVTSANVVQNFCRVVHMSPKHLKFYQNKSCPVFLGTQLFGEKRSQSRVDRLKTSAAGAPGTLPATSAPCSGSRARLGVRAARSPPPRGQGRGPLRACRPWNASRIYRAVPPSRSTPRSVVRSSCQARLPRPRAHSEEASPHRSTPEAISRCRARL
jgi:hypothetical protein